MAQKSAHSNGDTSGDQGPGYRLIDHTADLGFTVEGATLEDVFARAAMALHDIIADIGSAGSGASAARDEVERRLDAEGADLEDLLVRFLEEAHYAFEGERTLFRHVDVERVEVGPPARVRGRAMGERFDPARHELRRPVKAITYHGIEVAPAGAGGWRASVILDL